MVWNDIFFAILEFILYIYKTITNVPRLILKKINVNPRYCITALYLAAKGSRLSSRIFQKGTKTSDLVLFKTQLNQLTMWNLKRISGLNQFVRDTRYSTKVETGIISYIAVWSGRQSLLSWAHQLKNSIF